MWHNEGLPVKELHWLDLRCQVCQVVAIGHTDPRPNTRPVAPTDEAANGRPDGNTDAHAEQGTDRLNCAGVDDGTELVLRLPPDADIPTKFDANNGADDRTIDCSYTRPDADTASRLGGPFSGRMRCRAPCRTVNAADMAAE